MGFFNSNKPYLFRFYIAGESDRTEHACQMIQQVLDEKLKDQYDFEIINIVLKHKQAEKDGIHTTPTLAKIKPLPVEKVMIDFSNLNSIRDELAFLDEETKGPEAPSS